MEETMKKLTSVFIGILIIAISFAIVNCGGRKEKSSEKEEPGILEKAKDVAQGFKAISKTVEAAKKEEDRKPIDPVNFRELLPFLPPPISGWEAKEKPSGSTQSYGNQWKFSEVQQHFAKQDSTVNVKITDGAYIPMIYTAFTFASSIEEDTTERYHKGIIIGEDKGFEEYNYNNKDGKLMLLVNKRFLLELEGNKIDNTDILKDYLKQIDTKKLASLVK